MYIQLNAPCDIYITWLHINVFFFNISDINQLILISFIIIKKSRNWVVYEGGYGDAVYVYRTCIV